MDTKLELSHRYIIEGYLLGLVELTCIEIATNSYKIRFENGNTTWEPALNVRHWKIIDDLGVRFEVKT